MSCFDCGPSTEFDHCRVSEALSDPCAVGDHSEGMPQFLRLNRLLCFYAPFRVIYGHIVSTDLESSLVATKNQLRTYIIGLSVWGNSSKPQIYAFARYCVSYRGILAT
jgi:hypothetical protein